MTVSALPSPQTTRQLLDEDFLANRSRVLELAAFLDRLDRAAAGEPITDFRLDALREALQILSNSTYPRVDRIQFVLSDPGVQPLTDAPARGGYGAYDPVATEVDR